MSVVKWTEEQVASLNRWQENSLYHVFICPGDYRECENHRELKATTDGWVCQCGKYTQDWAHDFMLEDN
jgi:hypothetical protein